MKLGISQLSMVVILAAPLFAFATAQTRPDLNGTWKMNPTQSKFSDPDAVPKDVVLRFDHDNGRKIAVNAHDSSPDGETDDLLVFEKQ